MLKLRKIDGDIMSQLTEWIEQELLQLEWSQRELAKRAGLSPTTVNDVMTGNRPPTWDFCAAIAKPLGKNPIELFVLAGLFQAGKEKGGLAYQTTLSDAVLAEPVPSPTG